MSVNYNAANSLRFFCIQFEIFLNDVESRFLLVLNEPKYTKLWEEYPTSAVDLGSVIIVPAV